MAVVTAVNMMKDRQLKWKEKLEEMDAGRLVKQVYDGDIAARRPRNNGLIILYRRDGLCGIIPFIEHTICI